MIKSKNKRIKINKKYNKNNKFKRRKINKAKSNC